MKWKDDRNKGRGVWNDYICQLYLKNHFCNGEKDELEAGKTLA